MKIAKMLAALAFAGAVGLPSAASAALYTDGSVFGPIVEDFSGFTGLVTTGPQALGGGVTLTANAIPATVGAAFVDLGANGIWGAGEKFAMLGDELAPSIGVDSITLTLAGPSYGAGVYLSHFADTGFESVLIEALGTGGAVLESYNVTVTGSSNGLNVGGFYGIGRWTDSPDMLALRLTGDTFAFDNLQVTTAPVPSPSAVALLVAGLGGLGVFVRRGRGKTA